MKSQTNKWSLVGLSFVLITIASWKHVFDIIDWDRELSSNYTTTPKPRYQEVIQVKQIESNCGIRHTCPKNSFPIFLSTGSSSENEPKLCVSGKYVIKPRRGEGRGLNAAVIEPTHFEVVSVRNFDTYSYNKSAEIGEWLDGILDNDILIIFTSDEASAKLTGETKTLLNQLGSGKIQNLQYRSQWFMITQKGTQGFTTYEKITYSKKKSWGEMIEFRGCIPRKIPKKITTADEPLKENKKKIQFCEGKMDDKYKGFCNEARFEIIMPALQTNKTLVGNPVYNVPIFMFASENFEVFVSSVDSLIHQPGVVVSLITVLYESRNVHAPSVAKIYGMNANETKVANTFEKRLNQAKKISSRLFPKKKHLIVLDADVIPSPDFLFFMAQTFPILEKDKTAVGISGWSPNCYEHNGSVHLVYRVKGTPKYGALISTESKSFAGEIFAPDTARLQGLEACHLPSLEPDNWIERPQDLEKDRYFHKLVMLQQLSQTVDVEDLLASCSHSAVKNETNVIYVDANGKTMPKILRCLGVLNNQYEEYDGIVRLFVQGKNILLITSESSFYKSRPITSLELTKNDVKTSTQIGLPYSPARTIMYEKLPLPRVPELRLENYKPGFIYSSKEGLKSTYNESYKVPVLEENVNPINTKLLRRHRQYSKYGNQCRPIKTGLTEYKDEYLVKQQAPHPKGISVEKLTTCPMNLVGKDERDPLPLTENYGKYLDIYVSTTRLAHRTFTPHELKTLAMKNIVTSQETMDIPKGRGFGCKYREFAGQDLDNRDTNMVDKAIFTSEFNLRYIPKGMPKVPNFGSESETKAVYTKPEGYALPHLFDRFIEYPQTIISPTAKQTLSPPGMYSTEGQVIQKHTSPQTVV